MDIDDMIKKSRDDIKPEPSSPNLIKGGAK
jgi:hypothetical protein